jgi:hypothetical protein
MFREKQEATEIVIDLTGPEGNAFVLLGYAKRFAEQLGGAEAGYDPQAICDEMRESDYENLLSVFDSYFGHFVVMER